MNGTQEMTSCVTVYPGNYQKETVFAIAENALTKSVLIVVIITVPLLLFIYNV